MSNFAFYNHNNTNKMNEYKIYGVYEAVDIDRLIKEAYDLDYIHIDSFYFKVNPPYDDNNQKFNRLLRLARIIEKYNYAKLDYDAYLKKFTLYDVTNEAIEFVIEKGGFRRIEEERINKNKRKLIDDIEFDIY